MLLAKRENEKKGNQAIEYFITKLNRTGGKFH